MTRLTRQMRLIEILQSGRVLTADDLADILLVSRRTVFRDISALQEAGFLILQDSTLGGYHSPHRLALPPSELSSTEVVALSVLTRELVNEPASSPFVESVRSAVSKVRRNLPPAARTSADEIAGYVTVLRRAGETSRLDRSHFEIALHAAARHRQIDVTIVEADAPAQKTTLDVYRLLCLDENWHLVGFSSFHREVRLIEFAAVMSIEQLPSSYMIPERFNLERFLHHLPSRTSAPEDAATTSLQQMRIDPGSTWDDRDAASQINGKLEELHRLLNDFGDEVGSVASSRFHEKLACCREFVHGLTAEITAGAGASAGSAKN